MPDRPHLLLFNPDQWRADAVGCFGNPMAKTPHVDAACDPGSDPRRGGDFVAFRRAFCQATVCTPSRCSFLSGWYPHVRGHRTMNHMLHAERGEPNLLRDLKEAGYHVVWCGKNDALPGQDGWQEHADEMLQPSGVNVPGTHSEHWDGLRGEPGGDNWHSFHLGELPQPSDGEPFRDNDWARVHAVCDHLKAYEGAQPLCVFLPILYPHPPYAVEEPYFSSIDRAGDWPRAPAVDAGKPVAHPMLREAQGLTGWSETRWAELRAVYLGMVERVDAQFGMLMNALRDAGIYDQTGVFCFSDHGDYTGDFGLVEKAQNLFEDCLTNVPLLVKPPAGVACEPGIRHALVELVDLTATVYELAGVTPGHDHFGRSLLPVLAGGEDAHRDAVFCEGGRRAEEPQALELGPGTRDPLAHYAPRMRVQEDDVAHGKAAMVRTPTHKYVRRDREADELYDLHADPLELDNRTDDPALAGVKARLQERLLDWYVRTCDVVPREPDERAFRGA